MDSLNERATMIAFLRSNRGCLLLGMLVVNGGVACSGQIDNTGGSSGSPGGGSSPPGTVAPPGPTGGPNAFIDPSPRALSRLTNAEYAQVVTDLLGEAPDAPTRYRFPSDPRQHGFDNNADLLQVSATHGDRYAAAAEGIAAATFAAPDRRGRALPFAPAPRAPR